MKRWHGCRYENSFVVVRHSNSGDHGAGPLHHRVLSMDDGVEISRAR